MVINQYSSVDLLHKAYTACIWSKDKESLKVFKKYISPPTGEQKKYVDDIRRQLASLRLHGSEFKPDVVASQKAFLRGKNKQSVFDKVSFLHRNWEDLSLWQKFKWYLFPRKAFQRASNYS